MARQYGGPDRRKFKRFKVNFMMNYSVRKPQEVSMAIGNQEVEALMVDLSEEGMAISSIYDIPVGSILLINFIFIASHRKDENRVRKMMIEGEVVNRAAIDVEEYRLGIRFIRIKEEDKLAIAEFVKAMLNNSMFD